MKIPRRDSGIHRNLSPDCTATEALPWDWPGPVLHVSSTGSTQDLARRWADIDAPPWSLVLADFQTQGRGRMGRPWNSGLGGLYMSVILRPALNPGCLAGLSLQTAEAVARAIAISAGLKTKVKPPNDVLASPRPSGPFRKVCGILVEASGNSKGTEWAVVGIGVNTNNRIPESLPQATSLSKLLGHRVAQGEICRSILEHVRSAWDLRARDTGSDMSLLRTSPPSPRYP